MVTRYDFSLHPRVSSPRLPERHTNRHNRLSSRGPDNKAEKEKEDEQDCARGENKRRAKKKEDDETKRNNEQKLARGLALIRWLRGSDEERKIIGLSQPSSIFLLVPFSPFLRSEPCQRKRILERVLLRILLLLFQVILTAISLSHPQVSPTTS